MAEKENWFQVSNIQDVDSPALLIYLDRVKNNIVALLKSVDDVIRLRPHIKTHKSEEVSRLMLQAGIKKFKCATIAEAEMLAKAGAPDVLLAYQPVGPKIKRLGMLVKEFSKTRFSCLIDNAGSAREISEMFSALNLTLEVYIDLNVGMNRTGIEPEKGPQLYEDCRSLKNIRIVGLHAYDGHLRDPDLTIRTKQCDEAFQRVVDLKNVIKEKSGADMLIVAGGTPTFSIHSKRKNIECSPGTFIYWDKGYEQLLKEQHYLFAAIVVTRIISKPADGTICVDLGHKAIASENPLPNRVTFLNATDLEPIGHSEEHMVFKTKNSNAWQVGDVLYGVPYHVCPTVALHDKPWIVEDQKVTGTWNTLSRNRKITI